MDKTELGKKVYANLCKAFELIEFQFGRNEEKLSVSCVCSGDDMRINVFMRVDPESRCVTFFSAMPFTVKKEKIGEVGLALCHINNKLKFGKFDIDTQTGAMDYNFCNYYDEGSPSSPELIKDILSLALHTVDKYNDKFAGLNSGQLSLTDFLDADSSNMKN